MVDSHLHLTLNDDIPSILLEAKENGVNYLIVSGCSKEEIKEALEIVKKYSNIYLTVGYHPAVSNDVTEKDLNYLEKVISSCEKIIGIGEIGLDYHYGKENIEVQKKLFIEQLELAKRLKLPVIIHTRDATNDTHDILKNYNLKGIIHCFSGSRETAKQYINLGFKLGIGGVITFKNNKLIEVIKDFDLSNFVLETDSPYLSPIRGEINKPSNIKLIAEKIAEIKNIKVLEVKDKTTSNIKDIFDLNIKV